MHTMNYKVHEYPTCNFSVFFIIASGKIPNNRSPNYSYENPSTERHHFQNQISPVLNGNTPPHVSHAQGMGGCLGKHSPMSPFGENSGKHMGKHFSNVGGMFLQKKGTSGYPSPGKGMPGHPPDFLSNDPLR